MDRSVEQIIEHYLSIAGNLFGELGDSILEELQRVSQLQPNALSVMMQNASAPFVGEIAANLTESRLAAWIMGLDEVERKLPFWLKQEFQNRFQPEEKKSSLIFDWFVGSGNDGATLNPFSVEPKKPEIRYSIITNAMQRLADRNVLTRDQWDQASSIAKADSFFLTGNFLNESIEKVRDSLIEDLQQGTSLEGFQSRAGEVLRSEGLSESRIENIYRTNVQSAFRDGRETIGNDPIVMELFPYQGYFSTRDARAREDHAALENLGIDGTNVYRRDDSFWDHFTPPWGFNCRCTAIMMTLEQAAKAGVREAQNWLDTGDPPTRPEYRLSSVLAAGIKINPNFGNRGKKGLLVL